MSALDSEIIVKEIIPPLGNGMKFEAKVRWYGESETGSPPELGISWGRTYDEATAKMRLKLERYLTRA